MSKRTDAIRGLFAQTAALSADNAESRPRAPSGPVRSMRDTFSGVERENEDLRAQIAQAAQVLELDPELIDPSPFADRFAHDDDPAFAALKASLEARGQEVPILVRATGAGRFQAAYGHRRLRAARQLGLKVKAIVRALSDDDLVVAQGLENSAREDLSFIERALFALRLEEAGRGRALIAQALAIDKAEASKLISVARCVPREIAVSIGKAAKAGRPRWQAFAQALNTPAALKRVRALVARPDFASAAPDQRFARAFAAAAPERAGRAASVVRVRGADGSELADISASTREIRVALTNSRGRGFAEFLAQRLPRLLQEFVETESATD